MKAFPLGLQTNPVTAPSAYDQTKPFYSSRIAIRPDPISSINCVGVNPIQFYDVFDDTTAAPAVGICATPNGRLFVSKGFAAGVITVSAYSFNVTTGAKGAWIGDLKFTFPAAATWTLKNLQVDDTSSSSMIFTFTATHTTAANGGLAGCWGVPITDFLQSAFITYPAATTTPSLTKTVYMNVDVVGSNTLTTAVGHAFDQTVGGTISNYYVFCNTAALPRIYKFSMASPPSGTVTGGFSSSNYTLTTGTFTALTGTIVVGAITCGKLGANHGGGSLSGFACLTYMTTTNIYACKLSDITSAAVTLPSQITTTTSLDTNKYANAFVTPTITFGTYDQLTDRFYMVTSVGRILCKQIVNNDPNGVVFGTNDVTKTETGATALPSEFGAITDVALYAQNGWLFQVNTATGQRGIQQMDVASDSTNNLSFVLSPVMTINSATCLSMYYHKALKKRSVTPSTGYRTSNFNVDPNAGMTAFLATFTFAPTNTGDLSAVSGTQVQFITMFTNMGTSNTNTSQIIDAYLLATPINEISDKWVGSVDNTTQNGASPAYTAFRLEAAYSNPASVPTLYFRAYDDSNALVASANTSANPTLFKYSTNNGTSWNALGTIPNTPLTTEVRYEWATPPGVRVVCSLRES
jgi:hypothetical protein